MANLKIMSGLIFLFALTLSISCSQEKADTEKEG
jgi:hypothetical protein